ncbi:hypothetical protein, partial [Aureivirga sp. CE67]|uniref:hypothetical protein n=1 Tax=Aureivirga sp. CE67 TaxID=1788983 RepID=UPI001E5829B4
TPLPLFVLADANVRELFVPASVFMKFLHLFLIVFGEGLVFSELGVKKFNHPLPLLLKEGSFLVSTTLNHRFVLNYVPIIYSR